MLHEHQQDPEGLFLEPDLDAVLAQLAGTNVELERREAHHARRRVTLSDRGYRFHPGAVSEFNSPVIRFIGRHLYMTFVSPSLHRGTSPRGAHSRHATTALETSSRRGSLCRGVLPTRSGASAAGDHSADRPRKLRELR